MQPEIYLNLLTNLAGGTPKVLILAVISDASCLPNRGSEVERSKSRLRFSQLKSFSFWTFVLARISFDLSSAPRVDNREPHFKQGIEPATRQT